MKTLAAALAAAIWALCPLKPCSVGALNGVKTDAITSIVVPAHAERVLSGVNDNFSPLKDSRGFVALEGDNSFSFEHLLSDAELVHSKLVPIMRSLYFRIFRVNLDSPCPLRARNDFCANSADGDDYSFEKDTGVALDTAECIPKCYVGRCQPHEMTSEATFDGLEHFVMRYADDEKSAQLDPKDVYTNNMWYNDFLGVYSKREDEPVYVDLLHNPPSHTGYRGADDWKNIYEIKSDCGDEVPCDQTEHLFRLISGMQSSVAVWAAWNYKCVNPVAAFQLKTELPVYLSNPEFYAKQLGNHPDRLENLYYTFQVMLKTLCRLAPFLTGFADNLGEQGHEPLKHQLLELLGTEYELCRDVEPAYQVRPQEVCEPAHSCAATPRLRHPALIQKFAEISDIINCIGCEKCRLHGKIKLAALQIAVRAFGQAEQLMLERNEIVALLHALDYFAESIIFVHRFDEQHKKQLVLYSLRVMLGLLIVLVVSYRQELLQALCHCTVNGDSEGAEEGE
ncbi:endoplasmic reticulum oxidoreductin, putative [Babesia caballi]|uniref:Endoplasmic reticulum oxidoreductin, putative n=1 Tax=Babesia caballi TaxID=5871 RepID=A0AAV4LXV7_BABCB|nr:endoplasmic reticulum oxidoreductin, putative [Babesia caballi]